jgi:hypothetical protein
MRRRRPNESKDSITEVTQNSTWISDPLNESAQNLLASPSLHSPVDSSLWRVNHTPRSSTSRSKRSYIEKPRISLKETLNRKTSVQEAMNNALIQNESTEPFSATTTKEN